MMNETIRHLSSLACLLSANAVLAIEPWTVDSQEEWSAATAKQSGLEIVKGVVSPKEKSGELQSVVKRFEKKRSASSITFIQSPLWQNWNPINASKRAWDSPLAGRGVSLDGVSPFVIQKTPPVDERTKPTGEIKRYKHPHWVKEDPENYKTNVAEYEVHSPNQEAFGDWAAISIGGQYYLFGDYDSEHGKPMQAAWFTSSDINKQFTFCDSIGRGHPDPDVCFAEGKFYLATQQKTDYISPGPWVEKAEVRVGVDTDKDGMIDNWTGWQQVKEAYDYIPGFSKQVKRTPAALDLSSLPEGFGFQFEVKLTDSTENKSKPILESIEMRFKN